MGQGNVQLGYICSEALTILRSEPVDENNQGEVDDGNAYRYKVPPRRWRCKARKAGNKQPRCQRAQTSSNSQVRCQAVSNRNANVTVERMSYAQL